MEEKLRLVLGIAKNGVYVDGIIHSISQPIDSMIVNDHLLSKSPNIYGETVLEYLSSDPLDAIYRLTPTIKNDNLYILHSYTSGSMDDFLTRTNLQMSLANILFNQDDIVLTKVSLFLNSKEEWIDPTLINVVTFCLNSKVNIQGLPYNEGTWDYILGAVSGAEYIIIPEIPHHDVSLIYNFINKYPGRIRKIFISKSLVVQNNDNDLLSSVIESESLSFSKEPIVRSEPSLLFPDLSQGIKNINLNSNRKEGASYLILSKYPDVLNMLNGWILSNSWDKFESTHDFIQILFPNTVPGTYNKEYTITNDDVALLNNNKDFIRMAEEAFVYMMFFYGMRYDERSSSFVIFDDNRYLSYFVNGGSNRHNHLRITRILKFLRLFPSLNAIYSLFKSVISKTVNDYYRYIPSDTIRYWNSS